MASKFYAVKYGKSPGIYTSWDACKKQVTGYCGAVYKSFKTKEEAYAFINNNSAANKEIVTFPYEKCNDSSQIFSILPKDTTVAYVDGSYRDDTKEFSYGAVIFYNNEEIHLSQKVDDPSLVAMRNVAGEIKGSQAAMEYALNHKCKELIIYHDYEGIARWCLGEWKTNKDGTIAYKKFYDSICDKLTIHFVKVKGHSNDKYNDIADQLAKSALSI